MLILRYFCIVRVRVRVANNTTLTIQKAWYLGDFFYKLGLAPWKKHQNEENICRAGKKKGKIGI